MEPCREECAGRCYRSASEYPAAIKKPDPDSQQREKSDPDPHQSETPYPDPGSDADQQRCIALVTPNLWLRGKTYSLTYFCKKIIPSGKLFMISWSYHE
jgi:hypothetical protein